MSYNCHLHTKLIAFVIVGFTLRSPLATELSSTKGLLEIYVRYTHKITYKVATKKQTLKLLLMGEHKPSNKVAATTEAHEIFQANCPHDLNLRTYATVLIIKSSYWSRIFSWSDPNVYMFNFLSSGFYWRYFKIRFQCIWNRVITMLCQLGPY